MRVKFLSQTSIIASRRQCFDNHHGPLLVPVKRLDSCVGQMKVSSMFAVQISMICSASRLCRPFAHRVFASFEKLNSNGIDFCTFLSNCDADSLMKDVNVVSNRSDKMRSRIVKPCSAHLEIALCHSSDYPSRLDKTQHKMHSLRDDNQG